MSDITLTREEYNALLQNSVPRTDYETVFTRKVQLEKDLDACNKLLKKVGICDYLRSKLETYEILLSDFSSRTQLRDYNCDPPNLDTLRINLQDETVRKSYYTHYNKWMDILEHSRDSRMRNLRRLIRQIGFQTYESFARYISILFVHVSNIIHNVPPDVINWEDENAVVDALRQWNIDDVQELNAVRCLYRIPTLN